MKTEDPNKILIDDNKEEEVDPFENLVTLVTSLVPLLLVLYAILTLGVACTLYRPARLCTTLRLPTLKGSKKMVDEERGPGE